MTRAMADEEGIALLTRLLAPSERNPDRTRPASAAPDYDALSTAESIRRFEQTVTAAERSGAIEITRGRRERRHIIERIRVRDPVTLANHLGRPPSATVASQARAALIGEAAKGEPWVTNLLDDIIARWSRGEPAFRLQSSSIDLAGEFLALLAAISTDKAKGLDSRTFSLRVVNDTKAFDRHAGRIAPILAERFGDRRMPVDEVWRHVGLERYAHPVHLRGPVIAEDSHGVLLDGRAVPFVSLHPELVPMLRMRTQPTALLTIENYASFNRQVREVSDEALVVYAGGFASTAVVDVLKALLTQLAPNVPFYHWGDVDPGGLRIFRFLEETLPKPPQPHLMDKALTQKFGQPAAPEPSLASIASTSSAVAHLADWLACGTDIKHLEQEGLDPTSPLRPLAGEFTAA